MPSSAQKAFKVATDPSADVRDFLEILEGDEALSARVVKIANSVFFDRGKGTKTLEESINVIGVNELRSLLSASTIRELFPSRHEARALIWQHDLAVGAFCRSLTRFFPSYSADVLYLAGLMHDVGKLLLLQRLPEKYTQVISLISSSHDFIRAEEQVFPFDHTEVGALIAQKWNFSEDLILAIRAHHLPWTDLTDLDNKLPLAVRVADVLVNGAAIGTSAKYTQLRIHGRDQELKAAKTLGISRDELMVLRDDAAKRFEVEQEMLSSQ